MNKRILIIEDEKGIRENLAILLNSEGFKTFEASDGSEGITLAQKILPDLIICDIMMPGKNGYEVVETLQKNKNTAKIPFLFLTARVGYADMRKGMELGADDYLHKPFKEVELFSAIKSRLVKRELFVKMQYMPGEENKAEAVKIKCTAGKRTYYIESSEIVSIEAERQYTRVVTSDQRRFYMKKSLKAWQDELPPVNFVKLHRGLLVNRKYLKRIERKGELGYFAVVEYLEGPIPVSRRNYHALMNE